MGKFYVKYTHHLYAMDMRVQLSLISPSIDKISIMYIPDIFHFQGENINYKYEIYKVSNQWWFI